MPLNPADRLMSDDELIRVFSDPPAIPVRSAIAFIYDEGMDNRSIEPVRDELHLYMTTVQEQGLAGEISDFRLIAHARRIGCALVGTDKAYRLLHERLRGLALSHAGVVFVPKRRTVQDVVDWIRATYERSVELDAPDLLFHELWKV